jgi:hypothetical protein
MKALMIIKKYPAPVLYNRFKYEIKFQPKLCTIWIRKYF